MVKTATLAALLLMLTACGGGGDEFIITGPAEHGCPADPTTFVGPLLPECVKQEA
jgi:hypothetical protein